MTTGYTPAAAPMHATFGECSLGLVLVGTLPDGVAAVLIGDDTGSLGASLQQRFPATAMAGPDASARNLVDRIVSFIECPSAEVDVPLVVGGTGFQRAVWTALREIPLGATATYAQVAARIGRPGSARAVARACAANAHAVLIPCHRVVRSDGGISGYRWGTARKRAILDLERGLAADGTAHTVQVRAHR